MTAAMGLAGMWWLTGVLTVAIVVGMFTLWAKDTGFWERWDPDE